MTTSDAFPPAADVLSVAERPAIGNLEDSEHSEITHPVPPPPAVNRPAPQATPAVVAPQGSVVALVADDTPIAADLLKKNLLDFGIQEVIVARDGEEAVRHANNYRPTLVFLDIEMPRKNGLEALREIRKLLPDTFVCMLSAHSSATNVKTALTSGANGFLVKPYHLSRLTHVLSQFRKRQGG